MEVLRKRKVDITLYHVDTVSRNKSFVSGAYHPSLEDGKWCGKGMYFWDNLSNADYWIRIKERHKVGQYNVAGSELICSSDDILDLTDDHVVKQLSIVAQYFANKYDIDIDMTSNGKVINFVYDILKEQDNKLFSVVKAIGYYPNKKSDNFIRINEDLSGKRRYNVVTDRARTIYCVRERDLVKNRFIVDSREGFRYEFSI